MTRNKKSKNKNTQPEKMASVPSKSTTSSSSTVSTITFTHASSDPPAFASMAAPYPFPRIAPPILAPIGDFTFLGGSPALGSKTDFQPAIGEGRRRSIEKLVVDLADADRRENALSKLAALKKETFHDLAPLLWFSFGTIAILLQEIVAVYPMLSPPSLTFIQSNRLCNALALLQCVAAHPETRAAFVRANIPVYLYSFIGTTCQARPFEYIRLTSLGVIGSLVKGGDPAVILFLISTEIMPLCLRSLETGTELSKSVAAFILQKILMDKMGLPYVCSSKDRLLAVNHALVNVINALVNQPSARLLKFAVKCYLRFSEDARTRWALKYTLPRRLTDGTFDHYLRGDKSLRGWQQKLLINIERVQVGQGTFTNLTGYFAVQSNYGR